jgi:hypothetical protein
MKTEILCALLAKRIQPEKFQLRGLEVSWLDVAFDTPENRAIVDDVIANYDDLAAAYMREQHMASLRVERNRRLDEADIKYCNAERWAAMTEAQRDVWRAYKQALRDLPATTEDPVNPVWPEMPG